VSNGPLVKLLGDVVEFQRGLTYAKGDEVESSGNIVLRATNIDLNTNLLYLAELRYISDKFVVPAGKRVRKDSLLICTASGSKSHLGKVAYIDDDYGYAFGGFMGMLTPKVGLLPRFLFHALTSRAYKDFIDSLSDGANINNLKFDDLARFPIPLPPLPEQRRIVTILDEAFAAIATAKANTEKNLANARAVFTQRLLSVFSKGGAGWSMQPVGEVARHSLGKMLDKKKNKGTPRPYLRNLNVRWFSFDLSDTLEMRFLPEEKDKFTAVKNDVLICEGGYPGRSAVWEADEPIYFQKAIHRVRFHEPAYSYWLVYYLYAMDQSGELSDYCSGTGIQHFTGETLARFPLPMPPAMEAKRLIEGFRMLAAETQRLESLAQQKLAALVALKASLLHHAFTGQLADSSRYREAATT
jgi:type I restriction enzyme S subunit